MVSSSLHRDLYEICLPLSGGSPWQGVSALWHFVVTHHYTLKHREWSTPMLWIYIPIQPKDQVFATSPIIN